MGVIVAAAVLACPGPVGATASASAPDPERNSTKGTGSYWLLNRSESQLNDFVKQNGARITSVEVDGTSPYRFSAVLVKNGGEYARPGWSWWFARSGAGVKQKIDELRGRIIDLEPYTVGSFRRFAFVMVPNTGAAAKAWWWNYDLTAAQVTADINKYKMRLIDLDTYVVNGQRRYSYVGIRNSGVDGSAWWWYPDAKVSFIAAKAKEFGARVLDLEPTSGGRFAVVLVKNKGTYWWWGLGQTASRIAEVTASHGVRIVDLERYSSGGRTVYAFSAVDNTEGESTRLRNLLDKVYDDESEFGTDVIRGVYVKEVGGPVIADVAGGVRFQPLSTLKLLPYAYAWEQIDQGRATLDSTVSWVEATKDDPDTDVDERRYASCLVSGAPNTKSASATWRDALPTMMWESHNRTLDSFLDLFGAGNLTNRAHSKTWGMVDTEMHLGCTGEFLDNRSTLVDLGRLFEGIDQRRIVKKASSRDGFLANMIRFTYKGVTYHSPITGTASGTPSVDFLRDLAKREAGASKQGIVEDFLKKVEIRQKGGSGSYGSNENGYSQFRYATIPFKQSGKTVLKSFVLGWFVYKLKTPSGCPDKAKKEQSTSCQAIWEPERADLAKLQTELFAEPFRLALATWPS